MIFINQRLLYLQVALLILWRHVEAGKSKSKSKSASFEPRCTRTDEFSAAVLVVHDGTGFGRMDADEYAQMGKDFVNAWDTLTVDSSTGYCDNSHNRQVKKVVVQEEGQGVTHAENSNRWARKTFLYLIQGKCNSNCEDHKLFAPDAFHNQSFIPDRSLGGNYSNPSLYTSCFCGDKQDRGPTSDEFLHAFKHRIESSAFYGRLSQVKTVYDVIEYKPFSCSDQVIKREETLEMDFNQEIHPSDEKAVSDGFVDAYNTLIKYYCTNANTHVESAELLKGTPGGTPGLTRERRLAQKKRFKLKINQKKRGPQSRSGVGNDNSARRLVGEPVYIVKVESNDGTKEIRANAEMMERIRSSNLVYEIVAKSIENYEKREGKDSDADSDRDNQEDGYTMEVAGDSSGVADNDPGEDYDEDKKDGEYDSGPDYSDFTYNHVCYCPLAPDGNEPPNEGKIQEAYQEMLDWEAKNGKLRENYGVQNLEIYEDKSSSKTGKSKTGKSSSKTGNSSSKTNAKSSKSATSSKSSKKRAIRR